MSTGQPAIVETYLRASNAHDTAAMLLCFAQDAVVTGQISGDSDGSPAEICCHLTLAGDHITALAIR